MTTDEIRDEMLRNYEESFKEAQRNKDWIIVQKRLQQLYGRFNDAERRLADSVLSEWVLSSDTQLRSYAMAIIEDFKIVFAIPALRRLSVTLERTPTVDAPFELRVVLRKIAVLEEFSSPSP